MAGDTYSSLHGFTNLRPGKKSTSSHNFCKKCPSASSVKQRIIITSRIYFCLTRQKTTFLFDAAKMSSVLLRYEEKSCLQAD